MIRHNSSDKTIPTYTPVPMRNVIPVWKESIESTGDWTVQNGSRALDTTNVLASTLSTPASVKLTSDVGPATGNIHYTISSAQNWSAAIPHLMVRFYIDPADYANLNLVKIHLTNTADNATWTANLWAKGSQSAVPGWNEVTVTPSASAITGGWDWSEVKHIYLFAIGETDVAGIVTFDYMEFYPKLSTPLVALTFDDSFDDQFAAAQYMATKGLKATFYIAYKIGSGGTPIGGAGKLTVAQLQKMKSMGHCIANHSFIHDADWVYATSGGSYTAAMAGADIEAMTEWMIANDLAEGARTFASPYAGWIQDGDGKLIGRYMDSVRMAWKSGALILGAPCSVRNQPIYTVGAWDLISSTTTTTHTDLDDNAISDGAVGVHMFHYIDAARGANYMSPAEFQTYIDALATHRDNGDLKVVTMAELAYEVKL